MQSFSISPLQMIMSLWKNRGLTATLTKREIAAKYRGSLMGVLWSVVNPMFMLVIYTFVFGIVFKARWNAASDYSKTEFALILFVGLMIFNVFAECINRAPTLIISNTSYVKKVVFPLEILPVVVISSALFNMLVSFIVWFAFYLLLFGPPPNTILLFPLLLIPLLMLILGLSWFLASLGVFVRDISQIISIITNALMFLSPIFYPVTAVPEEFRPIMYANPITSVVEQVRGALMWGTKPNWNSFAVSFLVSFLIAWLGFAWFQKTRKGFGDVI